MEIVSCIRGKGWAVYTALSSLYLLIYRYNLTALQAEEFLGEAVKHLTVFRDSAEFGWDEVQKDVRKMIKIKSKKWGTINSIKSYPSALHGDGKINISIVLRKEKKVCSILLSLASSSSSLLSL